MQRRGADLAGPDEDRFVSFTSFPDVPFELRRPSGDWPPAADPVETIHVPSTVSGDVLLIADAERTVVRLVEDAPEEEAPPPHWSRGGGAPTRRLLTLSSSYPPVSVRGPWSSCRFRSAPIPMGDRETWCFPVREQRSRPLGFDEGGSTLVRRR